MPKQNGEHFLTGSAVTRRKLVTYGLTGAAGLSASGLLAACGGGGGSGEQLKPTKGGVLKVASATGASTDSIDPHNALYNYIDHARMAALYDELVRTGDDGRPELRLAESVEPDSAGSTWTLRVREGVTFHGGRPLTADDVVFSIRRASGPKASTIASWVNLDRNRIEKVDKRTVRLHFSQPMSVLEDFMSALGGSFVVPQDFDVRKPVGTGPFAFKSFKAGEQSTFVRNPDYWDHPPLLDELQIIDITNNDARVNALLSGQVHAIDTLPVAQVGPLKAKGFKALESDALELRPFIMRVDVKPFNDPRVREAMKYIVNRKEMVESVLSGYGEVQNDVYSPFEPCELDLPQREQDLEKARSLLSAAGQSDLRVELTTAPLTSGLVDMCDVLAQQAKDAGVTIKVKSTDIAGYYQNYKQWPFGVIYLTAGSTSFLVGTSLLSLKDAVYNDTHYANPKFESLYRQALAELDEDKRCDLINEMRRIYWETSGWIVWGGARFLDGVAKNVGGIGKSKRLPLGGYRFNRTFIA